MIIPQRHWRFLQDRLFRSVRIRFLAVASAAVVPVAVFAAVVALVLEHREKGAAEAQLHQAADAAIHAVDQMLVADLDVIQTLALMLDDVPPDAMPDRLRELGPAVLEAQTGWLGLTMTAPGQREPVAQVGPPSLAGIWIFEPRSGTTTGEAGRPVVAGIVRDPALPEPAVVLRVPVTQQGQVRYTLGAVLRAWSFSEQLRRQALPESWFSGLVDQAGHIVGRSRAAAPDDALIGQEAAPAMRARPDAPGEIHRAEIAGGAPIYAAFGNSRVSGWSVHVAAPAAMIQALGRPTHYAIAAGAGGALLLSGFLFTATGRAMGRREEAERKSAGDRRLSEVAANFPGLIYRRVLHPDGRVSYPYVSAGFSALFGFEPRSLESAQPLAAVAREHLHPDDTARWQEVLNASAQSLEPYTVELRILKCGDGLRWVRAAARPYRSPDGSIVWDGVVLDITDEHKAQMALRESEANLRFALASAKAGPWNWDFKTGRIAWSKENLHLYGLDPADGMPDYDAWLQLVHPEDRAGIDRALKTVIDQRRSDFQYEFRIIHPERGVRWLTALGRIAYADDGTPSRISGLDLDVTDPKRTEAALRETEARLRFALGSAKAGTWDYDFVSGHPVWSEGNYRLYGLDPAQPPLDEQEWLERIVHPDDRERVGRLMRAIVEDRREAFRYEFRVIHTSGAVLWLAAEGRVSYALDGRALRMSGLNVDITERKAMERDLHAAKERAERADRAKSTFLAAASHDLRQPAQSVSLLTAVLRNRLAGHAAQEIVDTLAQAADAMRLLLDRLLDMSRLDAGLIQPKPEPVALGPLLARLATEYRFQAADKGLALRVVETRAWTRTDAPLLERILRNLIENALRYTEHGRIVIGCRLCAGHLRIDVLDTGVGIAPEHHEEIFEEFIQIGNSERDRTRGLGLGLAVVRRLGRLLGHDVRLRSAVGRGSCFSVLVPKSQPPAAAVPSDAAKPPIASGLAIVVDDDPLVLAGLRFVLEDWGWEVITAASADAALAPLSACGRRPDTIIADYRLRDGETGTQAIHRVRAACRSPVPAILLTGDTGEDRVREAARAGAHLMHKPVDPLRLRRQLAEFIQPAAPVPA